jgi:hypothetical protein
MHIPPQLQGTLRYRCNEEEAWGTVTDLNDPATNGKRILFRLGSTISGGAQPCLVEK